MDADGGVAETWVRFGDFNGVFGLCEVGAGDHEFLAARVEGALDDVVKVILVALLVMVDAAEDGVGEVDADLDRSEWVNTRNQVCCGPTSMYLSLLLSSDMMDCLDCLELLVENETV